MVNDLRNRGTFLFYLSRSLADGVFGNPNRFFFGKIEAIESPVRAFSNFFGPHFSGMDGEGDVYPE